MFSKIQQNLQNLTDEQKRRYDEQHTAAVKTYQARFDAETFKAAVKYMTHAEGNVLIDAAMAICGSPYYAPNDHIPQIPEVQAYLDLFKSKSTPLPQTMRMHEELDAIA